MILLLNIFKKYSLKLTYINKVLKQNMLKNICASIGQNNIPMIFFKLRSMEPPNNIRVAQLCPGLVKTEFQEVAFGKENTVFSNMEKPLVADDMANSIKFIIEAPAHVQIHDIMVRPTSQFY